MEKHEKVMACDSILRRNLSNHDTRYLQIISTALSMRAPWGGLINIPCIKSLSTTQEHMTLHMQFLKTCTLFNFTNRHPIMLIPFPRFSCIWTNEISKGGDCITAMYHFFIIMKPFNKKSSTFPTPTTQKSICFFLVFFFFTVMGEEG